MASISKKQQRFFQAVKGAKHNPNAPENLRKVASSMSDKDIDDFIKCESEFKTKKAILSVLKDIVEPSYLNEGSDMEDSVDAVATTFTKNAEWASYIKPYIGQPLSQKELEALDNFKEKQPTTISRTEIWYKSTDAFSISHTTVIRKMKDSGQFSYTSFQKQENPISDKADEVGQQSPESDGMDAGSPEMPQGGESPEMPVPEPKKEEPKKDDIIITKSILFKDDIKGASILIDFLKKLDL